MFLPHSASTAWIIHTYYLYAGKCHDEAFSDLKSKFQLLFTNLNLYGPEDDTFIIIIIIIIIIITIIIIIIIDIYHYFRKIPDSLN